MSAAAVDLYWLPLGAGGHSVRINGLVFEAVVSRPVVFGEATTGAKLDLEQATAPARQMVGGPGPAKRRRRSRRAQAVDLQGR